jgi:hypothetical protein
MSSDEPDGKVEKLLWRINRGDIEISTVDLSNCSLRSIPEELYQLRDHAELINLGGNELSSLPPWIAEFSKLKILFFANNNFEEIPAVLGRLPNLYMLSFKSNKIKSIEDERIPSSVGWLILTDNQFSSLPSNIGDKLPRLKKLMLAGNKLTSIPDSLSSCKELELVRLAGNQLATLPSWLFTSLPRLSWLALAGNPMFHVEDDTRSQSNKIDWASVSISDKLGEGASGVVYKGSWNQLYDQDSEANNNFQGATIDNIDVAIKLFKGSATSDGFPEDEMKASEVVGSHENSIHVYGRLTNHPSSQLGLVLSLIPPEFYTLGGPPSFDTVTRDVYKKEQRFSLSFIMQILIGVASIAAHLHSKHIMHGDLYAHNILVHRDTGFPLLGDFGAATRYEGIGNMIAYPSDDHKQLDVYQAIEGFEVRAYGCLIEELVDRLNDEEQERAEVMTLRDLQLYCHHPSPKARPTFKSMLSTLKGLQSR